ncbi:hypothetical protein D3C86_1509670 [compost metagenome]
MCSVLKFFITLAERRLSIVGPKSMLAPLFTFFKSLIKSCEAQTTPPTVSLLPLMYFVKLWITISAPNFAGATDKGEKVLSTTNLILCFLAILANPAISATSSNGLLTVSQYSTLVSGVIEASTISNLVISTKVVLIPNLGVKFFKKA